MSRHEEYQYLDLLQYILDHGNEKGDRTGTGTKSIFGAQMRFNLRNQFPILTTKRVFWKGVVEELLWFLRGETDSKKLEEKGVKIWQGNTSRDFLDKHNPPLRYPEGEIGPGYGFQWRNWGGTYEAKAEADFEQKNYKDGGYAFVPTNERFAVHKQNDGIDQLKNVIDMLRTNPNDRRMIVNAWNPEQVNEMALPPCHMFFQFYVANNELSCQMYQRSCDMFLGVPFNISSYALLTYIIASLVDMKPGDFIWSGGDCHIYNNHIDQTKEQLLRVPRPFPVLKFERPMYTTDDFNRLQLEHFHLLGYDPYPPIKADMAV